MPCSLKFRPTNPWRAKWRKLGTTLGEPCGGERYANSGFFGLRRENARLLDNWINVTLAFEQSGGILVNSG